jgi:hypothetical protein
MKNKIGVVAGDLFWSSIPYDSINVQFALNQIVATDIIMFEKDIRLNKKFSGKEQFAFDKSLFVNNKRLVIISNWDDLVKLSNDYDFLISSAKIAPKTRYPHSMFGKLKCPIGAWDVGGGDVLTDTEHYNFFLLKGHIWKSWMQLINPNGSSYVTGTPHYDYYYEDFCGFGKPIDKVSFNNKYKIQTGKKKILIAPSNPSSHTAQFKDNLLNLEKLSKISQRLGYELLVKTYPHDYVFSEDNNHYTGVYRRPNLLSPDKPQYEYLSEMFSNLKILESQDHFAAMKNVDYVFNMSGSHITWETFFTNAISFSMNYKQQHYYNTSKSVPDYIKFPDSIINVEIDDVEKIEAITSEDVDKKSLDTLILQDKFENQIKHTVEYLYNFRK